MNGATRDELEMQAREYVLGLLPEQDAIRIEQRLAEDDALQTDVRVLQERLRELDFSAAPETVSANLWSRIETRLDQASDLAEAKVVPLEQRPRRVRAEAGTPAHGGFWRGFTTAAVAASALFLALTGAYFGLRPPVEPVVIAVLLDAEANPGVIVEALDGDNVRIVPLVDIPVPAGQALEVWTKPDPDGGPVSLGLMQQPVEASLGGFDLPTPDSDQLYEITLEPETGSPIGRPTGPVLFKGFARIPR
jgi:anti-sigma-K factor RskA